MNNDKKSLIPEYSHKDRNDVPDAFKWKIEDVYPDIDEWKKDKALLLEMMEKIKPLQKDWTSTPAKMFECLAHIDDVEKKEYRAYIYTSLLSDTDMGNSSFQAMKGEMQAIDVNLSGMVTFVNPDILKLGAKKIHEYIEAEPRLKVYEFFFDSVLRLEKHILPSDKAAIVSRTGLFSGSAQKASSMLNDLDIPAPGITLSSGKKIRLNTATYSRYRSSENPKDRRKVMRTFWKNHARFRNTHAALLDGNVKKHFFSAGVHHYKSCLEAALASDNINTAVYTTLIQTVKDNLKPLHRYLRLKARLLKLDKMSYDDIYASAVPTVDKLYTIDEARNILMESLKPLGKGYLSVLEKGLNSGWMDVYPNKGKRSGAYSQGSVYDEHPYVLMNYNGKFSHVSTLTHEFGHALHSWFSNKTQPYPLSHYPIFLAEIASTFNENLLIEYMIKNETDDMVKLFILDQYLEGFRGTLFRQTLFADYELSLHQLVEQSQSLTPDWLDKTYLDLTRLFYGHKEGVVKVDRYIENEWSFIPHFYYNFYVYQYSTGIVASTALTDMVLKGGAGEQNRYLNFLKSGGTKYPLDTLKDAGVDLTTTAPIKVAIAKFDEIVSEMEVIVDRLKKKKKI
ncbi:MAG: oligoendopeptidase F [bacterium]|nr:oligoendopeptidase F [bacterium]